MVSWLVYVIILIHKMMGRDVVVSTIYHKGKSAKSELAITVFQLGERVKELIVSPCWCSHE